MAEGKTGRRSSELWAEFRFGVVGALLSSPPERGALQAALAELSQRVWRHPLTGDPVRYGASTIERWYYRCATERRSPVEVLRRKPRSDRGRTRVLAAEMKEVLINQHREHPSWSYQLHADNIRTVCEARGVRLPSAVTIRRWMQQTGLTKTARCRAADRAGLARARAHMAHCEVRSFENEYVSGLWHLDFHHCSRPVLVRRGEWRTPICVAVMDDHSRVACHVQWYLDETAETLVHGFSQAVQKRGLPRALLTDNGSAMMSGEFTEGLLRLGIVHETTLPYSPYQNGKQERFFGSLEGRLLAMLEGEAELTLGELNEATCAWVEMEYNRSRHEEIRSAPLERFLSSKSVARESPSSEELRLAFRREETRLQRRTDGTVSIEGRRFEIPARYRTLRLVRVRYAVWDLRTVHAVDNGTLLCALYPVDKTANAAGTRRTVEARSEAAPTTPAERPPLLQKLLADYAATGLPPAYLPKDDIDDEEER